MNKESIIAVPKTSNILERLNMSMSTGAIQEKGTYTHSSGRIKKVRSEGTEQRTTYTNRPKRDVQRRTVNGKMECQNRKYGI